MAIPDLSMDNIDLLAKDVSAVADFYHAVIGLPFYLPYEPKERWAAVQAGSVTIYIFETASEESVPRRRFDARTDPRGWSLIGLRVASLADTVQRLDGRVEWVAPERSWEHSSGLIYTFRGVYDPEGNIVSFTEVNATKLQGT